MEFIGQKGIPDIAARKAYKDGYYVEAIQILHGFIENQAQSLLTLVGCIHFSAKQEDIYDISDTMKFPTVLKILYILNQTSKDKYDKFNNLNSLRNKIVHQLYKDPYDKIYNGIPKYEYDKVFNDMLEETYFFTQKTEQIINL